LQKTCNTAVSLKRELHARFRLVPKLTTSGDLERHYALHRTLLVCYGAEDLHEKTYTMSGESTDCGTISL